MQGVGIDDDDVPGTGLDALAVAEDDAGVFDELKDFHIFVPVQDLIGNALLGHAVKKEKGKIRVCMDMLFIKRFLHAAYPPELSQRLCSEKV